MIYSYLDRGLVKSLDQFKWFCFLFSDRFLNERTELLCDFVGGEAQQTPGRREGMYFSRILHKQMNRNLDKDQQTGPCSGGIKIFSAAV